QRGHAAVVLVATAVEDDLLDAGVLGAGGDELADLRAAGLLVALDATDVGVQGRRGGQGAADGVVDDLGAHVARGAVHDETRGLGGAADVLAQAGVAAGTRDTAARGNVPADREALVAVAVAHYLPVFPTLRRICSPS